MTPMARIDGDQVAAVRLPRTGRLADGSTVTNYPALPADVLHAEGWREVHDDGPPDHDPDTHYVTRDLTVDGDTVRSIYTLVPLPEPEPDRLAALEDAVDTLILDSLGGL